MAMKVQYFGDVNDFRKYALLRTLSEVGRFRVGVCWMLTVADWSGHGDNRGYLRQVDQWRRYDPALFDALASAPPKPTIADLRRVENEALIPDATFFNDFTPDGLAERGAYHQACMKAFKTCEFTFFDPDNGLEVKSTAKGRKRSSKYAYLDEIADHYAAGRSIARSVSDDACPDYLAASRWSQLTTLCTAHSSMTASAAVDPRSAKETSPTRSALSSSSHGSAPVARQIATNSPTSSSRAPVS